MKRTITMLLLLGLIIVIGCEDKEAACSKTRAAGQCSLKQGCTKTGDCCGTCEKACKCPAGKCECKAVCKRKCTEAQKAACKKAGKCCGTCKKSCCGTCKKAATVKPAEAPAKKSCCGTCKK